MIVEPVIHFDPAAPVFRFDASDHSYWLDGVRIPSATQLIDLGKIARGKPYYTQAHRDRGSAVHAMAMDYDLGVDLRDQLATTPHRGYVLAYMDIVRQIKPTTLSGDQGWEEIEVPDYHPHFRYGVTKDRLGLVFGRHTVMELKSGTLDKASVGVQLALQALVAEVRHGVPARMWQRLVATVKNSGRGTLDECNNARDFDTALTLIKRFC